MRIHAVVIQQDQRLLIRREERLARLLAIRDHAHASIKIQHR
jgi:hypothetical protein